LAKQIGKLLRACNTSKPVCLNLGGLLGKETNQLDYILSGLKGNTVVEELNLSNNQLENEDLSKICEVIEGNSKI
jgi:hypothetical protein